MKLRPWNMAARDNLNLYVFIGVLLAVGAVFGVLLVNALTLEQQQNLSDELGAYMNSAGSLGSGSEGAVFWARLLLYVKWLLLIWLLGLSVVGLPFVLALDFLKGVLIGFAVGLMVRNLAWKGVLLSLATVAPQNIIVVPALIIVSVSAARFAHYVVRERLFLGKGRLLAPFLAHTTVAAMMLLLLCCAACWEAYVSPHLLQQVADWAAKPS